MKKQLALIGLGAFLAAAVIGCGKKNDDSITETTTESQKDCELEDGVYLAEFNTDSSMFHVNDAKEGKGILTVENGQMTIHIVLTSKNITNLYYGLAEDAKKEGAELLQPTPEEVTYSDGFKEEVNSFDVPVPYLDDEFDVALIGKKEIWYDHKVSVTNPVKTEESSGISLEDGEYTVEVVLKGGSGKTSVTSPTTLYVEDGVVYAIIIMSSEHYDYMMVEGEKYLTINESGNSTFKIPITTFRDMPVIADTTAMSEPHEIEYTLEFDETTISPIGTN